MKATQKERRNEEQSVSQSHPRLYQSVACMGPLVPSKIREMLARIHGVNRGGPRTRLSLTYILVLAGTAGAGRMAPPVSTRISARLKIKF